MAGTALLALQRLQKAAKEKEKSAPRPFVALPGFETVEKMTVEEFKRAGLVIRVKSAVLGEDVLFVSENAPNVDEGGPLVVYHASEMERLVSVSVECMKTLHAIKKTFRGALLTDMKTEMEGEG